jgi:hypothetical protein
LEADHLRQLFGRGRGKSQLLQLDAGASNADERFAMLDTARFQGGFHTFADIHIRESLPRVAWSQLDTKRMLDYRLAPALARSHHASFPAIPFERYVIGHAFLII